VGVLALFGGCFDAGEPLPSNAKSDSKSDTAIPEKPTADKAKANDEESKQSDSPDATENTTAESYRVVSPSEMRFLIDGCNVSFDAGGPALAFSSITPHQTGQPCPKMAQGTFESFSCNGVKIATTTNRFDEGFICTREFGKIKVTFNAGITPQYSVSITDRQRAELLRRTTNLAEVVEQEKTQSARKESPPQQGAPKVVGTAGDISREDRIPEVMTASDFEKLPDTAPVFSTPPELVLPEGHEDDIGCVGFNKDGTEAITIDKDAVVISWDVTTGLELRRETLSDQLRRSGLFARISRFGSIGTFGEYWAFLATDMQGGGHGVGCCKLNSGEMYLLSRPSEDRTMRVRNVRMGTPGHYLIACFDRSLVLTRKDAGTVPLELEVSDHRWQETALSPDGQYLATAALSETILWETERGTKVHTFEERLSNPIPVFRLDGSELVTYGRKSFSVWDVKSGKKLRTVPTATSASSVAFSPDGRRLLIAEGGSQAMLIDSLTGQPVQALGMRRGRPICADFSQDGRLLLVRYDGDLVALWEPSTGQRIESFRIKDNTLTSLSSVGSKTTETSTASLSEDGKTLSIAIDADTRGEWDADSLIGTSFLDRVRAGMPLATGPDGTVEVCSLPEEGALVLKDTNSKQELARLLVLDDGREWLALAPSGCYDGSTKALKSARWRQAGKLVAKTWYAREFGGADRLATAIKQRRTHQEDHPTRNGMLRTARAGLLRNKGQSSVRVGEGEEVMIVQVFRPWIGVALLTEDGLKTGWMPEQCFHHRNRPPQEAAPADVASTKPPLHATRPERTGAEPTGRISVSLQGISMSRLDDEYIVSGGSGTVTNGRGEVIAEGDVANRGGFIAMRLTSGASFQHVPTAMQISLEKWNGRNEENFARVTYGGDGRWTVDNNSFFLLMQSPNMMAAVGSVLPDESLVRASLITLPAGEWNLFGYTIAVSEDRATVKFLHGKIVESADCKVTSNAIPLDGAFGVTWGTSEESLEDVVVASEEEGVRVFQKKGEHLSVEGVPVDVIEYVYHQGKLTLLKIEAKGAEKYGELKQAIAKMTDNRGATRETNDSKALLCHGTTTDGTEILISLVLDPSTENVVFSIRCGGVRELLTQSLNQ